MFILKINSDNKLPKPIDLSLARGLQGKISRTQDYIGDIQDLIAEEENIQDGEAKGYIKSGVNEARMSNAVAELKDYERRLQSIIGGTGLSVNVDSSTSISETPSSENIKSSNPITNFIEDFIKPGIELMKNLAKPVMDFFTDMFSSAGDVLKNVGDAIGGAIGSVAKAVSDGAKSLVGTVVDSTKEFYDKGLEAFTSFFDKPTENAKISEDIKPTEDTKTAEDIKTTEDTSKNPDDVWSLRKAFEEMFAMLTKNTDSFEQ